MATTIYEKIVGDNTLVLDARQSFTRQINTGSGWTDMRLGVYWALIDTGSGNNTNSTNESVGNQNIGSNRIMLGLKDSSSTFATSSGARFVGMMTSGSTSTNKSTYGYAPFFCIIGSDTGTMYAVGYYDGTKVGQANVQFNINSPRTSEVEGTSLYHSGLGMRFVINNRGLSDQTITIYAKTDTGAARDYTTNNLRQYLDSPAGFSTIGTVTWNNGSTAYDIPDNFFAYLPFNGIKMRISALGAWIFSP